MRGSEFLGRRGHEEEVECDIFATCVGYNDEEYLDESDTGSGHYSNLSNEPALSPTSVRGEEQHTAIVENEQDSIQKDRENQHYQGEAIPSYYVSDSCHSQKSQNTRFYSLSTNRSSRNNKDGEPFIASPINQSCITDEIGTVSETLKEEKGKRNLKSNRAGARRYQKGRGARFNVNRGLLNPCPRRACYFEHEDRLAEPENFENSRAYHNERIGNTLQHQNSNRLNHVNNRGNDKTVSGSSSNQEKWLHDRFEQLQSSPNLPSTFSSSHRKPRGFRRRSGIFFGQKLTDQNLN